MNQATQQPQIVFVGLGKMGAPIARRLIGHGYQVSLFDIDPAPMRMLAKAGSKLASSPADVASQAEIVFASLPSLDAIREVALGKRGLCHGTRIRIYVDLSTSDPDLARSIAASLKRRGIAMLDAPVSGGTYGAESGTLAVMASGDPATFRRVLPIFEVLGNAIFVGERAGHAQMMKLINNLISMTAMVVTCEGFVMGVKAGLDPDTMLAVLNSGTARNSATMTKFPRFVLPRTFDCGSNMELPYKDVSLCLKEAERLGVNMVVAKAVKQLWRYGIRHGGGDQDSTRIMIHLERRASVKVVGKAARRGQKAAA